VVSFAFDDSFSVNGISTERAKTLLSSALQTWANYSLLDFVEVADPGAGNLVDILVQSSAIDGQGKTLAFAYFPTTGDITFDTSELWSENKFLETAVHELGHSLGLDHEDDTPAIMNSILNNRYTDGAFLLEDDINGIRNLYGSGKGSVTSLNSKASTQNPTTQNPSTQNPSTGAVTPTGTASAPVNLAVNGSFEEIPLAIGESGVYRSVKGWSAISSVGFKVDKRTELVGKAAEGSTWVELDTYGANNTMGQNVDTLTGQTYQVSVDFSNGGRADSTTGIEVFWEGKKLDTLSGGGKGQWKNFSYQVKGGDRKVSTIAFRAIGPIDNMGGLIDNIVITAAKEAMAQPSQGIAPILDPIFVQGLGATPTLHRDPISGNPQNLVAAELNIAPIPTEFM
jgi:Matrixin